MAIYLNNRLVSAELRCSYPISRMALTVQLDNRIIYCAAKHEKATILKYDEQMGIDKIRTDLSRVTRFSVADDKIATTSAS